MDFMDEEDMATNTNLLTTSRSFNSLNPRAMTAFDSTKSRIATQFGDQMSEYLVADRNAVCQHTKGIELLLKCGWRMGKNIGSKSTVKRLKLQLQRQDELLLKCNANRHPQPPTDHHLMFGDHILGTKTSSKHDGPADGERDDEEQLVPIYRPQSNSNLHGIGFDDHLQGLRNSNNELSETRATTTLEREIESKRGHKR